MFSSIINTAIPFALFAVLASAAVPQGVDPYTLPRNEVHLQLKDGKLIDQEGRTGYIASNHQFQFDDPPQHGFLIDRGFSLCDDGRLALNGSQEFWRCKSSNFYNLYDESIADYCEPIFIELRDDDHHDDYDAVNPLARGGKDESDEYYGIVDPRKDAETGINEKVDSGTGAPYHSRLFDDPN